MADRRKDTNAELSEVRTVHSRTVTALQTLHSFKKRGLRSNDPDLDEMIMALHKVQVLLEPWARLTKLKHVPNPPAPLPTREEILAEFIR